MTEPSPYLWRIFECPCPPNKNGFCTIPSECIAKRMIEQEDCDMVCKAMQELRTIDIQSAEKVMDELERRIGEYQSILPSGGFYGGLVWVMGQIAELRSRRERGETV